MKYKLQLPDPDPAQSLQRKLDYFKSTYHSQCIFTKNPPVPGLEFSFQNNGILYGEFTCTNQHQGYNDMVHGGILAAIVDASMAQCLMGHGIIGYTTDLNIKYCKPFIINNPATLETAIHEVNVGKLYNLKCAIFQNGHISVKATGRFFKIKN